MPPDPKNVAEAAALLRAGKLCAFPTETVYGLGADATNADAVLSIFETKGRPRFNPLIVHCTDAGMAERFARFSPLAEVLSRFWPGPLTLVLPLREGSGITDLVTSGLDTLGLRVPGHPLARELIAEVGLPIAGPSANPSGRLSPTSAEAVREGFEGRVPVLDGGPCKEGVESTILAVSGERVVQLRPGALARNAIEEAIGRPLEMAPAHGPVLAPGMLASHYAPRAWVRLNATRPEAGEAFLAFGEVPAVQGPVLNLSQSRDLREAARNLFAMLNALDRSNVSGIAVAPIPETGLGEAINDRLRRAAAPRP